MVVEQALYSLLSGNAGVAALVATRISPITKPEDATLPAITYRRISSQRFSAMGRDAGVIKGRFQIDVWADTYDSAVGVKEAVRAAVQRYSTVTGVTIYDIFIISEIDFFEDDTGQYHIAVDIEINYIEV